MFKILYDFNPVLLPKNGNVALREKGYRTVALVDEKKKQSNITNVIRKILGSFDFSLYARIIDDDKLLEEYSKKFGNDDKVLYPMKSAGFLYFKLAELHTPIDSLKCLENVLDHWGHHQSIELFCFHNERITSVKEYLDSDLYESKSSCLLDYVNAFEMIFSQSGECEFELILKAEYFNQIKRLLTDKGMV